MGLLGSLARRSASAALYGSGRLVSVVVPDSITPWNLRRTATHTTGSLIGLGMSAYRKSARKKKATKKRLTASGRKPKASQKTSGTPTLRGFLPLLSRLKPKRQAPAQMVLVTSAPSLTASRPRKPGPRPSTTKGVVNLSRKAAPAQVVAIIHQPVPNEAKKQGPDYAFRNAWSSGRTMQSATDWDTPDPRAVQAARRRRSRVARAGGKFKTRKTRR